MSKEYQNNPINGDEHVLEQLSDYMDGLLSGAARDAVRAHLETCTDCRADYIELRATQKLMQNMPALASPRSFTLTPEMAGKVHKPSFWESLFLRQNAPRLATGSLVAFLILFLFVANDFLGKVNPEAPSIVAANIQSAPSTSYGGAAQPPSVSGPEGQAAAAPTETTAPAAPDTAAGADQTPHTSFAAPAPLAPSSPTSENSASNNQQPEITPGQTNAQDRSTIVTPNTNVAGTGNSSPTTTTLNNLSSPEEPSADNTTTLFSKSVVPEPANASSDSASAGWIALQIGLLVVGLGLAVAAFVAWRRS